MAKQNNTELKLQRSSAEDGEARKFAPDSQFWYDLVSIVAAVVLRGGFVAVYTSVDRAAMALMVKAGKDRQVYWIGPDDDPYLKFEQLCDDWGLGVPDDVLRVFVDRFAAQVVEDDRKTGKAG